jgi:hypothetical protein
MIRFINNTDSELPQHQAVITALFRVARQVLELPETIEVVFEDLGESVYGDTKLNPRFLNRMTINSRLFVRDLPSVFVHEIIHVHQTHMKLLKVDNMGTVYWRDRAYHHVDNLSYEEYLRLPWEADVVQRHQRLLEQILDVGTKKS